MQKNVENCSLNKRTVGGHKFCKDPMKKLKCQVKKQDQKIHAETYREAAREI